jgi:hypothetical protein
MGTVRVKLNDGLHDELRGMTSMMIAPGGHLRIEGMLDEESKYNIVFAHGKWVSVMELIYAEKKAEGE